MPSFSERMPSPKPFPNSGSFLGPKTRRAMKKMTNRCMGENRPSSIKPPKAFDARLLTLLERAVSVNRLQLQRPFISLIGGYLDYERPEAMGPAGQVTMLLPP